MPSTDITTCASLHCPKRWRCAEHYSNNVIDSMYASHYDAYKPELGGCEWYREFGTTALPDFIFSPCPEGLTAKEMFARITGVDTPNPLFDDLHFVEVEVKK